MWQISACLAFLKKNSRGGGELKYTVPDFCKKMHQMIVSCIQYPAQSVPAINKRLSQQKTETCTWGKVPHYKVKQTILLSFLLPLQCLQFYSHESCNKKKRQWKTLGKFYLRFILEDLSPQLIFSLKRRSLHKLLSEVYFLYSILPVIVCRSV